MKKRNLYNWMLIMFFLLLYVINYFKILPLKLQFVLSLIGGGILIYSTYQQKTSRFVSIFLIITYVIFAVLYLSI
jgi:hypothetical protein